MGRARTGHTPAGTFARDMLNRLLIDLSWASSMLEGNTYSRLGTDWCCKSLQPRTPETPRNAGTAAMGSIGQNVLISHGGGRYSLGDNTKI
jgi:hypothetical protein